MTDDELVEKVAKLIDYRCRSDSDVLDEAKSIVAIVRPIIEREALEKAAKAFEAEVDTWDEMERLGYRSAIKRKGAKTIRAPSEQSK